MAKEIKSMWRNFSGKPKKFTPDSLWKSACDYFKWIDDNPFYEQDFRGKDATEVSLRKMRPYTIHGLCVFLGVNTKYFNDLRYGIEGKEDEDSRRYSEVITRIYDIVYEQKFSGAAVGFFQQNIIARDLGMTEKSETKSENVNLNIEPSQEEAARIAAAILKDI